MPITRTKRKIDAVEKDIKMPITRTKRKIDAVGKEIKVIKTKETSLNGKSRVDHQLKSYMEKYQNLLDENNKNLELIKKLKEKVAIIENGKSEAKSQDSQTISDQTEDVEIPCKECIFIATCEEEVKWHMSSEHSIDEPSCEVDYPCNVCGRNCKTRWELMSHRKKEHPTTIKICRYFIRGECSFGDKLCWFSHNKNNKDNIPQTLNEFKCSFCGEVFKRKLDFMKHRKSNHPETISECINEKNGFCRFQDDECWFRHEGIQLNNEMVNKNNESSNMFKRLFSIMENLTERFENIEKQI